MAMDISNVYNRYISNYAHTSRNSNKVTEDSSKTSQAQLSPKAQKLLEKLKKTYGNVDFMVADFDKKEEVSEALSHNTKEFSVVFSSEELEKMASDETYEKEYMSRMEEAMNMSKQINQDYGLESLLGDKDKYGEITKISISVNQDGTTTFFADLEKASKDQQKRIESVREEKASQKKEEAKKAEKEKEEERLMWNPAAGPWKEPDIKKVTVQANSMEELANKIREIDWDAV